jgi:hypothetical protein
VGSCEATPDKLGFLYLGLDTNLAPKLAVWGPFFRVRGG